MLHMHMNTKRLKQTLKAHNSQMSLEALKYIQHLEDRITVYEHNIDLNAINKEINTLKEQLKIANDLVYNIPITEPAPKKTLKDWGFE